MLKKLLEFLGLKPVNEQNGISQEPVRALKRIYYAQLGLAEQIKAHAQAAPYPHVAERLRRVAEEKSNACESLRGTLLRLGSYVETVPVVEIKPGRNHWEQLAQDLNDQSVLERTLRELSRFMLHHEPEIAELLNQMLASETVHREVLTDLLMRADPQAHQT